jgi:hypothetical protein
MQKFPVETLHVTSLQGKLIKRQLITRAQKRRSWRSPNPLNQGALFPLFKA